MTSSESNIKIIRGNSTGFDACIELAAGLPEYFDEDGLINLSKDIRIHRLFLAVEAGHIRGFITVNIKYQYTAEISWLAVDPKQWRRGFGTSLVNYVVREIKKQNVKILEVKTLSSQIDYPPYKQTRSFYKKLGFILIDVIDPYPGWQPGNPCAIYVKIL